jgi:hypothetical protein
MISDTDLRNVGTDCGHGARDFVTKDRRCRDELVCSEKEIGVTQPRSLHVDENLSPDRRGDVHIFEVEPAATALLNPA